MESLHLHDNDISMFLYDTHQIPPNVRTIEPCDGVKVSRDFFIYLSIIAKIYILANQHVD